MMNTREAGAMAEQIAQAYLVKKGYRIIATNWQYGHLELDIIAQDGDELVIVEVKSRTGTTFGHPTEALTNKKMRQIIEAADAWIQASAWGNDTRFDLITVVFDFSGRYQLEHFDNAFTPWA